MHIVIIVINWLSFAVFLSMIVYRFRKLSSMPLHVRWELYPVAHAPEEKRKYGGSYMEETDWINRKEPKSLKGEIAEMLSEILYLHRVKKYNPFGIWFFSLMMHWGIYFYLLWVFLLSVNTFAGLQIDRFLMSLGLVSFLLGASGAALLAFKRATCRDLKLYTAPADYFHLVFLFALFVTGLVSWSADSSGLHYRKYFENIFFQDSDPVTYPAIIHFMTFSLFMLYMPFSKLFHFVAKYFTFHKVLWDDAFKVKGSEEDRRVTEQLSYTTSWSAPHIKRGATWLENASSKGDEKDNE